MMHGQQNIERKALIDEYICTVDGLGFVVVCLFVVLN